MCVLPLLMVGMLWLVTDASAFAPVKLKFTGQFGREVNATETGKGTEAEDVCLAASGDTCQPGKISTAGGGFNYAYSAAIDKPTGDIYVADENNNRIEKFGPNGEFLLMWGMDVNVKTGRNLCKAGEECRAGKASDVAGGMHEPQSLAIDNTCLEEKLSEPKCAETDPANGNIYVLDKNNGRVDEYGPEGQFILAFGGKVNKTAALESETRSTEENVCPAAGHLSDECQAGTTGSSDGFFEIWAPYEGQMLAVGGPEHLVYVADQGRVQIFSHTGSFVRDLLLTSTTPKFPAKGRVTGVDVDRAGDVFVTESYKESVNSEEEAPTGIYEFAPGNMNAVRRIAASDSTVEGLAIEEETGRLAVTDGTAEGTLYELASGEPVSRFGPPGGLSTSNAHVNATGLSFNAKGQLYVADPGYQDIEWYTPAVIAELNTGQVSECQEGLLSPEVLVTVRCVLNGTVDSEGVAGTEAWFQWSTTSQLIEKTPKQSFPTSETPEPIKAPIIGLAPNQSIYYDLAAFDSHLEATERLASQIAEFRTPTVPPRIVGQPAVSFVKPSSAVFTGNINPENDSTEYYVEYATGNALAVCPKGMALEACSGVNRTRGVRSSRYWTVGATLDAVGLEAGTAYHYRLNAVNEKEETAVTESGSARLPEGEFTTPVPVPPQASSTQASSVSATTAVITGDVNPEGEPATYTFEFGVYNGPDTHYVTVETGSAGNGTEPVAVQAQLSGLQPDRTYVYVIEVQTAYGTAYASPVTFTTEGLPTGVVPPSPPEMLPVPPVHFPAQTQVETRAQKLRKALHACKLKRNKKQRARCARKARKRYGILSKHRKNSNAKAPRHSGSRKREGVGGKRG